MRQDTRKSRLSRRATKPMTALVRRGPLTPFKGDTTVPPGEQYTRIGTDSRYTSNQNWSRDHGFIGPGTFLKRPKMDRADKNQRAPGRDPTKDTNRGIKAKELLPALGGTFGTTVVPLQNICGIPRKISYSLP